MGILDDAIKEHLELKRQHGAADSELQQLEDEAFGAAERPGDAESAPDPVAEAPTEFMTQPEVPPVDEAEVAPEVEAETAPAAVEEATGRPQPRAEIADLQEGLAGSEPGEDAPPPEEPAEEESPAMEHEAIPELEPEPELEPTGPSTEEREAIAEQPTEIFDVEGEIAASQPSAEPAERPEVDFDDDEEDDDFWSEQRLSDELDQALEAPAEDEDEMFDEDEADKALPEEEPSIEQRPGRRNEEDVLEETPDFLEEAPEDDQLWFEQKPPKGFDFDD